MKKSTCHLFLGYFNLATVGYMLLSADGIAFNDPLIWDAFVVLIWINLVCCVYNYVMFEKRWREGQ